MANTKCNTTQDVLKKIRELKGKTTRKFYQNPSNFYDEMIYIKQSRYFQFGEDMCSKGAQNIAMIMHEVLLILKFL